MKRLINTYEQMCGYSSDNILGPSGGARISLLRQLVWVRLLGRVSGLSTRKLACIFNRAQSTVVRGINRAKALLEIKDREAIHLLDKLMAAERIYDIGGAIDYLKYYSQLLQISIADLTGSSQASDITIKRFTVYYDLYHKNMTYEQIGQIFGKTKQAISYGIAQARDMEYTKDYRYIHNFNKLNNYNYGSAERE